LPFAGLDAVGALKDGKIDAVWINAGPDAPPVQALLINPSVRLMDFPTAEAFTRIFPDLVRVVLPKGVIEIDPAKPPNDVTLLGTTGRILIRNDVHRQLCSSWRKQLKKNMVGQGFFSEAGNFP
jgi:hypothetical protein